MLKYNDLESSFDEEYKDVLKNQFWSYIFISESWFNWIFFLKADLNGKKAENYRLKKIYKKILKSYIKINKL